MHPSNLSFTVSFFFFLKLADSSYLLILYSCSFLIFPNFCHCPSYPLKLWCSELVSLRQELLWINNGRGFCVPLSFRYASHIGFFLLVLPYRFLISLVPPRPLLTLSVCNSVGSKQVHCEPDTQLLWNSVLALRAPTEMLLVLVKQHCHRPLQTRLACQSAREKGSSKFQLLAFAVQKRVRAQSQLDLVSSGRWVI